MSLPNSTMTNVTERGVLTSRLYEVCCVNHEILEDTVVDYIQRLEDKELGELNSFLVEHYPPNPGD